MRTSSVCYPAETKLLKQENEARKGYNGIYFTKNKQNDLPTEQENLTKNKILFSLTNPTDIFKLDFKD